jgi:DNA primase
VRIGYVADPGATFIAPYSIQLLPNAPVAMPTFWYELEQLEPERYTPTRVIERLETIPSDPWERLSTLEQRLTEEHRASLAAALKSALRS